MKIRRRIEWMEKERRKEEGTGNRKGRKMDGENKKQTKREKEEEIKREGKRRDKERGKRGRFELKEASRR